MFVFRILRLCVKAEAFTFDRDSLDLETLDLQTEYAIPDLPQEVVYLDLNMFFSYYR